MALYYKGDLEKDLAAIKKHSCHETLFSIGRTVGFGRGQKIMNIIDMVETGQASWEQIRKSPYYHENYIPYCREVYNEFGLRVPTFILQVYWAKHLKDRDIPTMGALGLESEELIPFSIDQRFRLYCRKAGIEMHLDNAAANPTPENLAVRPTPERFCGAHVGNPEDVEAMQHLFFDANGIPRQATI